MIKKDGKWYHTHEEKRKISCSRVGPKNPFFGKHHSDETKDQLRQILGGENHPNYGKHLPKDVRRKISQTNKKRQLGENNPFYGRKHTEESKRKISQSRGNISGKTNPNWRGGSINMVCPNCKGIFAVPPCRVNMRKFCSFTCKAVWMSVNLCGEANPSWKGGIANSGYSPEFNDNLREQIRERDNYACRECGIPQMEYNRRLAVHHIDYDKWNNDPDNLISLCMNCHNKTHFDREKWQEYFEIKRSKLDRVQLFEEND